MTCRSPVSSVRVSDTNRRRFSASTFASCAAGSASMIFASTMPQHPARRLPGERGRGGGVDHRDRGQGQLAGHRGDPADQPGVGPAGQEHRPGERQPVPQVEHVRGHRPRREHVHAAGDAELAQGELADPRGALAAEPDQPVGARRQRDRGVRAGVVARVGGLQVAPVPHQPQVVDLDRPPAAHDQLQTRERLARVEVDGRLRSHAPLYSSMYSVTRRICQIVQNASGPALSALAEDDRSGSGGWQQLSRHPATSTSRAVDRRRITRACG